MFNIGEFLASAKRIFIVSKKPTWQEYKTMAKITGLGIVLIAVIGFIIDMTFNLLKLGK